MCGFFVIYLCKTAFVQFQKVGVYLKHAIRSVIQHKGHILKCCEQDAGASRAEGLALEVLINLNRRNRHENVHRKQPHTDRFGRFLPQPQPTGCLWHIFVCCRLHSKAGCQHKTPRLPSSINCLNLPSCTLHN